MTGAQLKAGSAPEFRDRCAICGAGPTVKSHLLPAAIGHDIRGDQPHFWVGSISQDGKRITQSGSFDRFLCETHEAALHAYEDSAISFCRAFALTPSERATGVFTRADVTGDDLVRFACSVLWRFHISALPETRRVDIGAWEPTLRAITFDDAPTISADTLIYAILVDRIPVSRFAIPPAQSRMDDRRAWSFIVSGVGFMVKLDARPFSARIRKGVINGRDGISGVVKPLNMDDLVAMKQIAGRMQASRPLS